MYSCILRFAFFVYFGSHEFFIERSNQDVSGMKHTLNCSLILIKGMYSCISRFAFFLYFCSHQFFSQRSNQIVSGSEQIYGIIRYTGVRAPINQSNKQRG